MTWAIFSDEHVRGIGEIIRVGSPRVTAIVGGAMLDDTLRRTLSERLINDEDTAIKLLRVGGPLGKAAISQTVRKTSFWWLLTTMSLVRVRPGEPS